MEVATCQWGRGVVRSTAWAALVLGVEGARPPSSSISKSSSPSDPDSSALGGGASGLAGGVGRARHSLEKASWSQPQLGQWWGEVGQQPEMGRELPPFGQVGFWHQCAERVW